MRKLSSIIKPLEFQKKPCLDEPGTEFIVLHNNIIEARYRLTLQEKRIVLWLASQVTLFDEDFKEHHLSVKEFAELTHTKGENLYTNLQSITRRLMQRIITLRPIEEGRLIQVAWLGAADYKIDKGIISLSFHPHLKPFFLQLKRNFTKINLGEIMGLQSIYSVRIYELLKQKKYIGSRVITLKDIREYCGISEKKYKQVNDFQRKVLDTAKRDINDKTDLEISYSMLKEGRKYTSVAFSVKNKKENEELSKLKQEMKTRDSLIKNIEEFGFSRKTTLKMISGRTDFEIEQAILAVEAQIRNGNVKNSKGMLRSAIKDCWKNTSAF